jgi:hypothetical protein
MIEREVIHQEGSERIVKSQKEVYGKKNGRGLIYVISLYNGVSIDTVILPTSLPESCENPIDSESIKIRVGSLRIQNIPLYRRVLHGQKSI